MAKYKGKEIVRFKGQFKNIILLRGKTKKTDETFTVSQARKKGIIK